MPSPAISRLVACFSLPRTPRSVRFGPPTSPGRSRKYFETVVDLEPADVEQLLGGQRRSPATTGSRLASPRSSNSGRPRDEHVDRRVDVVDRQEAPPGAPRCAPRRAPGRDRAGARAGCRRRRRRTCRSRRVEVVDAAGPRHSTFESSRLVEQVEPRGRGCSLAGAGRSSGRPAPRADSRSRPGRGRRRPRPPRRPGAPARRRRSRPRCPCRGSACPARRGTGIRSAAHGGGRTSPGVDGPARTSMVWYQRSSSSRRWISCCPMGASWLGMAREPTPAGGRVSAVRSPGRRRRSRPPARRSLGTSAGQRGRS